MRILIPVAAYFHGTTGTYVDRALQKLGHEAKIGSQYDLFDAVTGKQDWDLIFCVDSGGPLDFLQVQDRDFDRVCMWYIDFRTGKRLKNPNDFDTAQTIQNRGGWVFQAQFEDFEWCVKNKITRTSFLPLAADPDVWSNEPVQEKKYDVSFVGNVWDGVRTEAIELLRKTFGNRAGISLWNERQMESAAELIRQSLVGFNISSFYGSADAYDLNMRCFEVLSCGIPLVTNHVRNIERVFGGQPDFIRTYKSFGEILRVITNAVFDGEFVSLSQRARQAIADSHTYVHRIQQAFETLKENGVGKWSQSL